MSTRRRIIHRPTTYRANRYRFLPRQYRTVAPQEIPRDRSRARYTSLRFHEIWKVRRRFFCATASMLIYARRVFRSKANRFTRRVFKPRALYKRPARARLLQPREFAWTLDDSVNDDSLYFCLFSTNDATTLA